MKDIVKIVVTIPPEHAEKLRQAIGKAGGGMIGEYSFCSFTMKGTGRFKPGKKAHPFVGEVGVLDKVEEERIEITCEKRIAHNIVKTIREHHPYEEPAIDIYLILSF